MAAARGDKTTAQSASEFEVHAGQVAAWKKQLLEHAAELFADGRRRGADEPSTDEQELYEQIGRLKMEVEWLKKNLPDSTAAKRNLLEVEHQYLSIARQCELLNLPRSSAYYAPAGVGTVNAG